MFLAKSYENDRLAVQKAETIGVCVCHYYALVIANQI
jgi:hypothetical protein